MSMLTPRGVGAGRLVRRRGTARRVVVVLVALVVISAVAAAAWRHERDGGAVAATTPTPSCPTPSVPPSPPAAQTVRVNVYNATDKRGLASRVATEMRKRGFLVGKVDNDPAKRRVTGVAEIRSSTLGAAAALTVAAQVDAFVAVPDQRKDATVDLVVGAAFHALRTPAAAAAALRPTPAPRPSGC